jgi:predicted Zn-dependent protease
MHRGDLDRAEKLAIAYLRRHPQDTTSWEVWSTVLRARDQREDEARILRRGIDFTGAPRLRFRLAQILASSGDLDQASALLDAFSDQRGATATPRAAVLRLSPAEG